jgi:hypothetical protein
MYTLLDKILHITDGLCVACHLGGINGCLCRSASPWLRLCSRTYDRHARTTLLNTYRSVMNHRTAFNIDLQLTGSETEINLTMSANTFFPRQMHYKLNFGHNYASVRACMRRKLIY